MSRDSSSEARQPSWMVVYVTYNLPEAHVIVGRLFSEGIAAWVHQEPGGSAIGITIGALGEVKVLVDEADYDRALVVLEGDDPVDLLDDDNDRQIFEDKPDDADE